MKAIYEQRVFYLLKRTLVFTSVVSVLLFSIHYESDSIFGITFGRSILDSFPFLESFRLNNWWLVALSQWMLPILSLYFGRISLVILLNSIADKDFEGFFTSGFIALICTYCFLKSVTIAYSFCYAYIFNL